MATLGHVKKKSDGSYEGRLEMLSFSGPIRIVPVYADKASEAAPDFRVLSGRAEIGAGWTKHGEKSGQDYVSLSLRAPELGDKPIYVNLGRAAGQDEADVFSLIWNTQKAKTD